MANSISDALKAHARSLGFDAVGICAADAAPRAASRLNAWLARGYHGDMAWMAARAAQRGDPRQLWDAVRSVVMLGLNYGPADDPLALASRPDRGAISVYARGDDYHEVIKPRLKALARWLVATAGGDVKVFVDTAPVMEKPLAEAAGLGWQGKHSNLVSRSHGSWLLLGALYTTLDLVPDAAHGDACGQCTACLDACPTQAFTAPALLDARRCISYLTIENKGPVPPEFRAAIGNRIYGCDDCLAVCPWNKFAEVAQEARLTARDDLRTPRLDELVQLDDAAFRQLFARNPVKRIGRDRFVRNVLIAIANSADRGLLPHVRERLDDAAPLVRGAAVWALRCLAGDVAFAAERQRRLPREGDPAVRGEWG